MTMDGAGGASGQSRGSDAGAGGFVVLDRDGTLIVEQHYLSDPAQVELIAGAAEGLRRLDELGLHMVVITNQSGIARRYFDEATVLLINERLRQLLEVEGVRLGGIYVCPHLPDDGCRCRKPEAELLERAARDLGCAAETAFVIGDKSSDVQLGQRVGATTFLVRTGYGANFIADSGVTPDYVVNDLRAAAQVIERLLVERRRQAQRLRPGW